MNDSDKADLLRRVREEYQNDIDADQENRKESSIDLKFLAGEQWPNSVRAERKGRPMLTINRLPQFVKQVTGEMRQNRPSIRVLPKDDSSDPKLAEVYTAIIRHIESNSDAHRVYVKAGEQAVRGGIGHFRVLTDWAEDAGFEQEILIETIRNPLAVVWDHGAQKLDKSDADHCFVTKLVPRKEFERLYPKAALNGFDSSSETWLPYWREHDSIRVAEYWCKKETTKRLALMDDGATVDVTDVDEPTLATLPVKVIREVKSSKIYWYKLTATDVLEQGEWAGRFIPIIPVVGEEIELGDRVLRHGLVRYAKDAQQSYNYWRSAAVEHIALAPKAPFLATAEQVDPYKSMWDRANTAPLPYLLYKPDPQAPGAPRREPGPAVPAAMYQEAQVADQDMKATTGIYDASLGRQGNETSGKAIIARQQEGDTATYVYLDNMTAAIQRCGRILVDLIPRVYTDERVIRIVGEDGDLEGWARINAQMPDGRRLNDISVGRYDVAVSTGPAYATKRQQAADSMMQFVQAVPAAGQVAADLIAKSMDWPNADKLAARLEKILPPQLQENAAPPPPNPLEQLGVAKAEADVESAQLDNAKKSVELAAATGQLQQLVAMEVQRVLMSMMAPPQDPQMGMTDPASAGFFNAQPEGQFGAPNP